MDQTNKGRTGFHQFIFQLKIHWWTYVWKFRTYENLSVVLKSAKKRRIASQMIVARLNLSHCFPCWYFPSCSSMDEDTLRMVTVSLSRSRSSSGEASKEGHRLVLESVTQCLWEPQRCVVHHLTERNLFADIFTQMGIFMFSSACSPQLIVLNEFHCDEADLRAALWFLLGIFSNFQALVQLLHYARLRGDGGETYMCETKAK